jgi:glyoxylase-like metal-dependent hydrolase (beta-lactamase superfamily II)
MSRLSRRAMLAGAAAAAAAATTSDTIEAAAPKIGKQAPGYYRYKVGDFEITVIQDGVWLRKLEASTVPNVAVADVQRALTEAFQPADVVSIPFSPIVVNTGSKLVMLDTSVGGRFVPTTGTHMENFLAAGLDPKAVDLIVVSHFHPDHVNGIWTKDDKIAFPNAEIMVPAQEWAYWMDDARQSSPPEPLKGLFANNKRVFAPIANKVTRFEPGKEVAPGITSLPAFGHTPGHCAFVIASGNDSILHIQDSVGNPALFARYPEWQYGSDMDRAMAVDTRKKLLDRAAADKQRIQAMHFPFPGTGYIVREGTGYRFQPAAWTHLL